MNIVTVYRCKTAKYILEILCIQDRVLLIFIMVIRTVVEQVDCTLKKKQLCLFYMVVMYDMFLWGKNIHFKYVSLREWGRWGDREYHITCNWLLCHWGQRFWLNHIALMKETSNIQKIIGDETYCMGILSVVLTVLAQDRVQLGSIMWWHIM